MRQRLYILLFLLLAVLGLQAETYVLTLDSCLNIARRNNPAVRKAQLEVQKAQEVKSQALTKYFPQIQATAGAFHALNPVVEVGIDDIGNATVRDLLTTLYGNYGAVLGLENTLNLFQYGYMAGVTAIQPVFVGGKIVAGNQLAKVGVEAAQLQAEIAERDMLEQVEECYWLLYGLDEKQALIDEVSALLDTLSQKVDAAVSAGLALPSDGMAIQLQRDEIERRRLQVKSGKSLARRALALSIGLAQTDSIMLGGDTLTSAPITSNPLIFCSLTTEHRLLQLQIRAAELQKRMALADALPQVAFGANYGYGYLQTNLLQDGLRSKTGNGALFVTVSVPLTQWWETGHKLRQQSYAIEQAKIDADYLGTQLDLRTQQAYDQVTDALALLQLQERTAQHAEESYRQTQVNYEAGMATISELLMQQTALTKSRTDLTDARIAYRVALRRYNDLTGSR